MAKKKDIKDLTLEELNKKLIELNDSMLNYRFQKTLQQLEDPKQISENKKDIARVKTFIRQFELGLRK
jgi:large subunit ribosomal protein L29|tara:strand:- start:943 stop:1146 length:204 start_codon:yes stop_codon:yes gene_type:complete